MVFCSPCCDHSGYRRHYLIREGELEVTLWVNSMSPIFDGIGTMWHQGKCTRLGAHLGPPRTCSVQTCLLNLKIDIVKVGWLLAMWLWVSNFTSLSLWYLICSVGIFMPLHRRPGINAWSVLGIEAGVEKAFSKLQGAGRGGVARSTCRRCLGPWEFSSRVLLHLYAGQIWSELCTCIGLVCAGACVPSQGPRSG